GNQAVSIRHFGEQKNGLLRLRDEDGFDHDEELSLPMAPDCPAELRHPCLTPCRLPACKSADRMSAPSQYRYGFESGKAFLINSTRGSASSASITSTTSKRKSMSGFSSIRSQASAPREIRFCFARSTASSGRPKSSRVRVFTSTNTRVSLSRHTTSISPPLRPRKLRKRIL